MAKIVQAETEASQRLIAQKDRDGDLIRSAHRKSVSDSFSLDKQSIDPLFRSNNLLIFKEK